MSFRFLTVGYVVYKYWSQNYDNYNHTPQSHFPLTAKSLGKHSKKIQKLRSYSLFIHFFLRIVMTSYPWPLRLTSIIVASTKQLSWQINQQQNIQYLSNFSSSVKYLILCFRPTNNIEILFLKLYLFRCFRQVLCLGF